MEPLESVQSAQLNVVELKMPLSAVGGQKVRSIFVQTWMAGQVGDQSDRFPVNEVEESDSSAAAAVPPTAESPAPNPSPRGPVPVGTLLDQNLTIEVVHLTGPRVNFLNFDANDEPYTIDFQGNTIYKLLDDGTLQPYLTFPGQIIEYFDFAPDGTIWFVDNGRGLYRVDPSGTPQLVASQVNRYFVFDSNANLIAIDYYALDTVQRISPTGEIEIIADDVKSQQIAIDQEDRIYLITSRGELLRIYPDGNQEVLASGFGIEDQPRFGPDQTLYVHGVMGLVQVDLETGSIHKLDWYDHYRVSVYLSLDSQGTGYIYHPNTPLYRMDLAAQSFEMIYSPLGNSWAMAVDPTTGSVYAAYGDFLPDGSTTIYRVAPDGTMAELGSVGYGSEVSMAIAPDGTGYLGVLDSDKGAMIFKFDPQDGSLEEFYQPKCAPKGLIVEPATSALWWMDCNQLVSVIDRQLDQSLPYFDGVVNNTIGFDADGSIYTLPWFNPESPELPAPHGIYLYRDSQWVQLIDMTTEHPGIVLGELTVCPDGQVYVITGYESDEIPGKTNWSVLVRLEADHSLTVLGYNLGNFDPLAISCPSPGTLYFTNAEGIYSISNLGEAP